MSDIAKVFRFFSPYKRYRADFTTKEMREAGETMTVEFQENYFLTEDPEIAAALNKGKNNLRDYWEVTRVPNVPEISLHTQSGKGKVVDRGLIEEARQRAAVVAAQMPGQKDAIEAVDGELSRNAKIAAAVNVAKNNVDRR